MHGEKMIDSTTGREERYFPSMTEVAARYGVSKNRVWQYASKYKCLARRKETALREQIRYDRVISARRADVRALETDDVVRIIDAYIEGFGKALEEGKVRFDNPPDLDRLVRLKELITGGADSRHEIQGGLTLEAIQQRHQQMRGQVDTMTPELAGTDVLNRATAELTGEVEG